MDELRENVIWGLEHCKKDDCSGCPYENTSAPIGKYGTDELVGCIQVLCGDAISLLKAQEPKTVVNPNDNMGYAFCPSCGKIIIGQQMDFAPTKYCGRCGQAVKWE